MSDNDKSLLQKAFSVAVTAVRYGIEQQWKNAHWLSCAKCPNTGFDPTNADETEWWTAQLNEFAGRLALTPIVECDAEILTSYFRSGRARSFHFPKIA